jgi:uncharacterized Zn finger protein (UPF0148 family)
MATYFTSIENVNKNDLGICPRCGVLFVNSIKGISNGLFRKTGVYCPICDVLVAKRGR